MRKLVTEASKPANTGALRTPPAPVLAPNPPTTPTVSVAYAYGDEISEKIANSVTLQLQQKGFLVQSERIINAYKGNINQFIQNMGSGQAVVVILSKKFLESEICMNIALTLEANKNIAARIFPIVLDSANVYDPVKRLDYLNFWDQKITELNEAIKGLLDNSYADSIYQDLNKRKEIRRFIDTFAAVINNMNALTPDIHMEQNFADLITGIEQQFQIDNP